MVQVDARHLQRAAGGREQAAQHAERGRLAGAVGPEQAEDLAALDLEADVIDGGESAEPPDQIVDLDHRLVRGHRSVVRGRWPWSVASEGVDVVALSLSAMPPSAPQQDHEAVFETRRHRA